MCSVFGGRAVHKPNRLPEVDVHVRAVPDLMDVASHDPATQRAKGYPEIAGRVGPRHIPLVGQHQVSHCSGHGFDSLEKNPPARELRTGGLRAEGEGSEKPRPLWEAGGELSRVLPATQSTRVP
jgi:hypothetical protein